MEMQKVECLKNKKSFLGGAPTSICPGFYLSTFLQLVSGSRNSILYQVFKLNLFKSLQVFLLYVCLEKP